jgi:hypothetical protein
MTKHRRECRDDLPPACSTDRTLLAELEGLWGLRARPAPHDPQGDGWLVCASVLGLIGGGCGTAALTLGDVTLLVPAAAAAGLGTAAATLHHRHRAFRVRGHPS